MNNAPTHPFYVFPKMLKSGSSAVLAITGRALDGCLVFLASLFLAKILDIPVEIRTITMLAIFIIVLIPCFILLHQPERLKKYDVIPEPRRTVEQINAMLYVCEKQPYIMDHFSKEMRVIIAAFSGENFPEAAFEMTVRLYRDLMNGHFQNVQCCIKELINSITNRESIWTTK